MQAWRALRTVRTNELQNSQNNNLLSHETKRETGRGASWDSAKARLCSHIFRIWTASVVLAAYVYGWLYFPELLTWWKRTTTSLIETGCGLLPYPWGDRIEATLGNFGLWVQITLAIIAFRVLVSLVISVVRRARTTHDRGA